MIKITIYIDVIFFENLIMNMIILYATSIILKMKPKPIRVILAGTIGSIYAILTYLTKISIYTSIVTKIILSVIMVYITFDSKSFKKMWKQLVIFYLTSFVFGGVVLYLIYYIKPQEVQIKNGIFVGMYVLKVIFLGAIIAVVVIKIATSIIKNKFNSKNIYCKIKIKLDNQEINTIAMIDTGNLAKEPITNTPVIIVESSLLYDIVPKQILNNIDNILTGNFLEIPQEIQDKFISRLRCIPFSSLGKQNGMLLGIKVDEVEIENEEEKKFFKSVIMGIYDKSLTKKGEYRALIGVELIQ